MSASAPLVATVSPAHSAARRFLSLVLIHGVLIAGALFMLAPFIWMLVTSIKPPAEIFSAEIALWPKQFYGVENYRFAMEKAPLLRFALNGVILCAGTCTGMHRPSSTRTKSRLRPGKSSLASA